MRRALASLASTCLGVLALLAAACGAGYDSSSTGAGATTSTSTAVPRPSTSQARVASLRDLDFTQQPYIGDLVGRAGGGEVTKERVRLVDLTSDAVEEAVVVVESGGTMGDIGVAVYRLEAGDPKVAFFRKLAGRVEVRDGAVVVSEGVPGPADPACCPSKVRETTIGWRGGAFEVTSERTIDATR